MYNVKCVMGQIKNSSFLFWHCQNSAGAVIENSIESDVWKSHACAQETIDLIAWPYT